MNYSKRFVVEPGARVKLHKIDPGYIDPDVTEKDALAETKKLCKRLSKLQTSLYCEKQRSVLIVLQALDTAGKDGVINHVLGAMNPLSCRAVSFKKPGPDPASSHACTIGGVIANNAGGMRCTVQKDAYHLSVPGAGVEEGGRGQERRQGDRGCRGGERVFRQPGPLSCLRSRETGEGRGTNNVEAVCARKF